MIFGLCLLGSLVVTLRFELFGVFYPLKVIPNKADCFNMRAKKSLLLLHTKDTGHVVDVDKRYSKHFLELVIKTDFFRALSQLKPVFLAVIVTGVSHQGLSVHQHVDRSGHRKMWVLYFIHGVLDKALNEEPTVLLLGKADRSCCVLDRYATVRLLVDR
jgi:hypothetical protein